jgi:arylsulfatase A-like enzyme
MSPLLSLPVRWQHCSVILAVSLSFFLLPIVTSGKTNFVVITVDDLGYGDVGAYRRHFPENTGDARSHQHTNEIDRLAGEGIICTRAYSAPWGVLGRQMLHSGAWVNRRAVIDRSFPWIGSRLRQAGYTTALFGNVEFSRETNRLVRYRGPEQTEIDQGLFYVGVASGYFIKKGQTLYSRNGSDSSTVEANVGDNLNEIFTDAAVDFIRNNSDEPFFLNVAYLLSRSPYEGSAQALRSLFADELKGLSDEQITNTEPPEGFSDDVWKSYHHAAVLYTIDRGVKQILNELERSGLLDDTVIFFVSTNGSLHGSNFPFTGQKRDIYEGGIRVPFIVWSNQIAQGELAGSIYDGLVTIADVAATIAAEAHLAKPAEFDGDNILPFLLKQVTPSERFFYYRNETLNHYITGAGDLFTDNKEPVLLETFILEKKKLLRFGGWNHSQFYEQHVYLPCVRNQIVASKLIAEDIRKTPQCALTRLDTDKSDRLLKRHKAFIEANEDNFSLGWSDRGGAFE